MFTDDFRGSIYGTFRWQWTRVLFYLIASTSIYAVHILLPFQHVLLPNLPTIVVGSALAIFVSFRTNAGYDRWWEGRKLWGKLVNTSRGLTSQLLSYLPADEQGQAHRNVHRHIGYVHTLRCVLRGQDPTQDPLVKRALSDEDLARLKTNSNPCHALLDQQWSDLGALARDKKLSEFSMQSIDGTLSDILDVQGGCERIRNTPFPRGYGFIAEQINRAFAFLIPLSLVDDVGVLVIPLTIIVCLSFALIGEVGRVLENPFTLFWPALPLKQLSTTIDINLRERLGETDLPEHDKPVREGVIL